jgi:para-nitrobenzyl esterase
MNEFLGIPYAAPPVGALRWQPPQLPARWHGLRDATKFASHCPQPASPFGVASTTEDCLYLNVYTPADHKGRHHDDHHYYYHEDRHGYPVMVWIHGGALVTGLSDAYDPTKLVDQDVVVVTLNYRLGFLGFLAHPALSAEADYDGSGDYGWMDQQAALEWVQRNIKNFGGDPDNVTIFGESAGGLSVHAQLASPEAAGLFHRAIVESGAYYLNTTSLSAAEASGTTLATALGCSDPNPTQTAACLRSKTVAELLAKQASASFYGNVDNKVLTQTIGAALQSGQFNQVPVMEGSNHDEWRLFVAYFFELPTGIATNTTNYPVRINASFGGVLPTSFLNYLVYVAYPTVNYPSPSIALGAVGTDGIFACNSRKSIRQMANFVPVFAYEFNDQNAPQLFLPPDTVSGMPYGAYHASEIQYIFNLPQSLQNPLDADQERLSRNMVSYWAHFARSGNPNSFHTPFWPQYDPGDDQFQSLIPPHPTTESGFAADHKCVVWP